MKKKYTNYIYKLCKWFCTLLLNLRNNICQTETKQRLEEKGVQLAKQGFDIDAYNKRRRKEGESISDFKRRVLEGKEEVKKEEVKPIEETKSKKKGKITFRINKYRLIAIYIVWALIHFSIWTFGGFRSRFECSSFPFKFNFLNDMINFIRVGDKFSWICYSSSHLEFYLFIFPAFIYLIYLAFYLWNKK